MKTKQGSGLPRMDRFYCRTGVRTYMYEYTSKGNAVFTPSLNNNVILNVFKFTQ